MRIDDEFGSDAPAVRLSAFGSLDPVELADLAATTGSERWLEAGEHLWREGGRLTGVHLLLEGWAASVTSTGDGVRRLNKVHLPGDVLGMPSLALTAAAETLEALTAVRLRTIPLHSLGDLFEAHPRIAVMLFLVSQEERVELMDRLNAAHHHPVIARVAAVLWRLYIRTSKISPSDTFYTPLTLRDLADLAGASVLNTRLALKKLRANEIVGWTRQWVTVVDDVALKSSTESIDRIVTQEAYWLPASS